MKRCAGTRIANFKVLFSAISMVCKFCTNQISKFVYTRINVLSVANAVRYVKKPVIISLSARPVDEEVFY